MERLVTLRNGSLTLLEELLKALGLKGDEKLLARVIDRQIVLQTLRTSEGRQQRLMVHLNLPVGSLVHQIPKEKRNLELLDRRLFFSPRFTGF